MFNCLPNIEVLLQNEKHLLGKKVNFSFSTLAPKRRRVSLSAKQILLSCNASLFEDHESLGRGNILDFCELALENIFLHFGLISYKPMHFFGRDHLLLCSRSS